MSQTLQKIKKKIWPKAYFRNNQHYQSVIQSLLKHLGHIFNWSCLYLKIHAIIWTFKKLGRKFFENSRIKKKTLYTSVEYLFFLLWYLYESCSLGIVGAGSFRNCKKKNFKLRRKLFESSKYKRKTLFTYVTYVTNMSLVANHFGRWFLWSL